MSAYLALTLTVSLATDDWLYATELPAGYAEPADVVFVYHGPLLDTGAEAYGLMSDGNYAVWLLHTNPNQRQFYVVDEFIVWGWVGHLDLDSDGVNAYQEFLAGTNPVDEPPEDETQETGEASNALTKQYLEQLVFTSTARTFGSGFTAGILTWLMIVFARRQEVPV